MPLAGETKVLLLRKDESISGGVVSLLKQNTLSKLLRSGISADFLTISCKTVVLVQKAAVGMLKLCSTLKYSNPSSLAAEINHQALCFSLA